MSRGRRGRYELGVHAAHENLHDIVVCCTFREFDGGPNDEVQRAFLRAMAAQRHPRLRLCVTNFRERHVRAELERAGVPHVFRQSRLDTQLSLTDMLEHATDVLTPGRSIFVYTNVDHVFPPDFFLDLERHFEPGSSGTWFPQVVYATPGDFDAGRPVYHPAATRTSPRMPFPYRDERLTGWLQMDPNQWLPDTVFIDGDILLREDTRARIARHRFDAFWPGQAQSVVLGFMGAPDRRKNLVFSRQYAELLNVYGESVEDDADHDYVELRAEEFAQVPALYETMCAFADDAGIDPTTYREGGFDKLRQVSQYHVVGSPAQRALFDDYLAYWRLRYQTRKQPDRGGPQLEAAAAQLMARWSAVFGGGAGDLDPARKVG